MPVGGLDWGDLARAHVLTVCFLTGEALGVLCHHHGDQFVVSHLGLFHALSIEGSGVSGGIGGQFASCHIKPTSGESAAL